MNHNDIKKESVADLREYILNNCITSKELSKLKENIEEIVNKRLNYFIKKQLYSHIEAYTRQILKHKEHSE